jgi:hypothetical protein
MTPAPSSEIPSSIRTSWLCEQLDEAFARVTEIIEAIHERAAKEPLKHLIDLAIVLSVHSDDPLDAVEVLRSKRSARSARTPH